MTLRVFGMSRIWSCHPGIIVVALWSFLSCDELVSGTCMPSNGCSWALAYYSVRGGDTVNDLLTRFGADTATLQTYNNVPDINIVDTGSNLSFPFPCQCVDSQLGHNFSYEVQNGDTVDRIANTLYEGLSQTQWILTANQLSDSSIINPLETLQIPVNCSCGDPAVSSKYGLFTTYAATAADNGVSLASGFNIDQDLLQRFNPSINWNGNLSSGKIVFIPSKEFRADAYPPYNFSDNGTVPSGGGGGVGGGSGSGKNNGLVIGLSIGVGLVFLLIGVLVAWLYYNICRKKGHQRLEVLLTSHSFPGIGSNRRQGSGTEGLLDFSKESPRVGSLGADASPLSKFTVDKSVEFSFEELAAGTNNFNAGNKIGEGGYGSVYLANIRGQKLAVKRMNLQATKEFMAEIQVLTRVHHTNLVQLVGYCTVESLFLIYEYVENGTLDRHLHGKNNLPPLSWNARVQIALDAARGLEYIHEHTKPTYIHRDVKSSNILIDKQFHGKRKDMAQLLHPILHHVLHEELWPSFTSARLTMNAVYAGDCGRDVFWMVADFGLTKLTESGTGKRTHQTRLVGTFGYMSPEYARYGDVSPKVDVYSFGVVLYEIVSAKEAIVRGTGNSNSTASHKEEQKGLVTLFDAVLQHPNGREKLPTLVDPALGDDYPSESAWKMTQLAGACTQEDPERRPTMRTVVVALMTLSSNTSVDWEMSGLGSDPKITRFVSGR